MSRQAKNSKIREAMCSRFQVLFEQYFDLTSAELSRKMGYVNSSVIGQILKGKVFPDTEKLYKLAEIEIDKSTRVNLDWLLTGEGSLIIFLKKNKKDSRSELELNINRLPENKAQALLTLLSQ